MSKFYNNHDDLITGYAQSYPNGGVMNGGMAGGMGGGGAGGSSGGAMNYFQSNSFSNNPLRKNNELNKARKELLTDAKFLQEQPKLSNFLFAKYLKEVSNEPKIGSTPETNVS